VILDIIAIFELLTSGGRGICSKLIWILIIIFFPILGRFFFELYVLYNSLFILRSAFILFLCEKSYR